ncbi:hypothetical protein Drorol1_Dr00017793 [Drosera rotundifolia]
MSIEVAAQNAFINRDGPWRVLLFDEDEESFNSFKSILLSYGFTVQKCLLLMDGLEMIETSENFFDLIFFDIDSSQDGIMLLRHISRRTKLPVVAISSDSNERRIREVLDNGGCKLLTKPVKIEDVKLLSYFVGKKGKRNEHGNRTGEPGEASTQQHDSCLAKTRARDLNEVTNDESQPAKKKPRFVWNDEMHDKFVQVIEKLGIANAAPKKILEMMNEPKLSRENVASHLQKYRKKAMLLKSGRQEAIPNCEKSRIHGIRSMNGYKIPQTGSRCEGQQQINFTSMFRNQKEYDMNRIDPLHTLEPRHLTPTNIHAWMDQPSHSFWSYMPASIRHSMYIPSSWSPKMLMPAPLPENMSQLCTSLRPHDVSMLASLPHNTCMFTSANEMNTEMDYKCPAPVDLPLGCVCDYYDDFDSNGQFEYDLAEMESQNIELENIDRCCSYDQYLALVQEKQENISSLTGVYSDDDPHTLKEGSKVGCSDVEPNILKEGS